MNKNHKLADGKNSTERVSQLFVIANLLVRLSETKSLVKTIVYGEGVLMKVEDCRDGREY